MNGTTTAGAGTRPARERGEHFDVFRLANLVRLDLVDRYRALLIASGAIGGILLLQALLFRPGDEGSGGIYALLLAAMLFIGGPLVASRAFRELHDKTRNDAYLLLPASALEKMLARLLLVTVLFAFYAFVFVTLLSWILVAVQAARFGRTAGVFSPAPFLDARLLGVFLLNQSVFALGAAWFRRQHFLKTNLALAVVLIGLTIFMNVVFRVFFPNLDFVGAGFDPMAWYRHYESAIFSALEVLEIILYLGVPVLCWAVVWMRIRETQVSHGV